ncbi:MAG: 30S ribosome-binding factor RbfA [Polyangiales bacterium]
MATAKRESHRADRVGQRVLEELATALRKDYSDPRLAEVVLSAAEVTGDLSIATVRFVVIGDGPKRERAKAALKVLTRAAPGLRSKLGAALGVRRTPELRFAVDEGREEVAKLDALLDEVNRELRDSAKKRDGE